MPCLAQQDYHAKLPATAGHYCRSLTSLIRETYAHCHVRPSCVRVPAGAGWTSGEDSDDDDDSVLDDAIETKQVILNEMRNRQMRKRSSYSGLDSPSPRLSSTTAFAWSSSYAPLDPRTVLEKVSSPKKRVVVDEQEDAGEEKEGQAEAADGDGECDADDESEAFYSVQSFFTRSTSRAATVASSSVGVDPPLLRSPPETWEGFRDCDGWPFGLCRRRPAVLPLPPLPSTPADSWKWRKSVSSLAGSPLPAYYTYYKTPSST